MEMSNPLLMLLLVVAFALVLIAGGMRLQKQCEEAGKEWVIGYGCATPLSSQ